MPASPGRCIDLQLGGQPAGNGCADFDAGEEVDLAVVGEHDESAGISPGLVRLSVGYTGTLEQRWQQLRDAMRDVERRQAYAKAG